jgi:transcriptional antiterminator NusG
MSGLLDDLKVKQEKDKKVTIERSQEYGVLIECDEKRRMVTAGTRSLYPVKIKNTGSKTETYILKTDLVYGKSDDSPDWPINLRFPGASKGKRPKDKKVAKKKEGEGEQAEPKKENKLTLAAGETGEIILDVEAPRGAKYGDRVEVILSAISETDPAISGSINVTTTSRQAILAVKTAIGHERAVADALQSKAKTKDSGIFAILSPGTIRGYVFVESMNIDRLRDIARGIPRAHGVVEGETSFKDVEHFLTPKPVVSGISEGAIVELIAGPFKGERAMVKQIDESKEEITVELIEAMVAIPVTVRGDHVRVIQKD